MFMQNLSCCIFATRLFLSAINRQGPRRLAATSAWAAALAILIFGFGLPALICPAEAAAPGTIKWTCNVGSIRATPAIAGGIIYAAADGMLLSISKTGQIRWYVAFNNGGQPEHFGDASPAILGDTIYIATTDAYFHSVLSDGTVGWNVNFPGVSGAGSPAIAQNPENLIYISKNGQLGNSRLILYSLSGQVLSETMGNTFSSPVVDPVGRVYALVSKGDGNYVEVYSPYHSLIWSTQVIGSPVNALPPAMDRRHVYVPIDAGLYAINYDGTIQYIIRPQDIGATLGTVVVGDGVLYGGSSGSYYDPGFFFALDSSNGKMLWKYEAPGNMWGSPCIGNDGTIYAVFSNFDVGAELHAINPDGTNRWTLSLGVMGDSPSSPVIAAGVLYIGVEGSRSLVAVNVESASLAQTDWPCISHDLAHTGRCTLQQFPTTILVGPYETLKTIQAAINASLPGDKIIVRDGTYSGAGNIDLDLKGMAITLKSQNGPANCIIDCMKAGRGLNFHSGESSATVVEGFTIKNGKDVAENGGGGGILISGSSPTIRNCTITGCEAKGGGGIAINSGSSPLIFNSRINANTSYGPGGGVLSTDSSPILNKTAIRSNIIAGDTPARGGGIYIDRPVTQLPFARISNCTIAGNGPAAGYKRLEGGGAALTGNVSIIDSTIQNNTAWRGGGIVPGPGAYIINCAINANSASLSGGAIFSDQPLYKVINSTFNKNQAQAGGTVKTAAAWFTNCTFATSYGTWITGPATVNNCIFWGNSAGFSGTPNINYSDVQGGWSGNAKYAGEGNIAADPRFLNPAKGDFHLAADSPCLDAGSYSAKAFPQYDKEGVSRVLGGNVDMGAYEYQGE